MEKHLIKSIFISYYVHSHSKSIYREEILLKRYRDFNTYLREQFGERVQRISLDAGLGCPNRDGTVSRGGCIFCDARGAGTGAFSEDRESISKQIGESKGDVDHSVEKGHFWE